MWRLPFAYHRRKLIRTLSATFLAAQKGVGVTGAAYEALIKIVLSLTDETNVAYDKTRIIKAHGIEEDDNGLVEVVLKNSDLAITAAANNFQQWQCVVSKGYYTGVARTAWAAATVYAVDDIRVPTTANGYQYRCSSAGTSHATTEPTWGTVLGVTQTDGSTTWEMDGNSGDEYSRAARLYVQHQEFISSEMLCRLYMTGIPNDLEQDLAEVEYNQASTDTNTPKDLISAILAATHASYTNYTAYTVTYDSEDSLIDTFVPADLFAVLINDNRLDKTKELLNYTGCKMRPEDDGAIHILDPVTTGTTYDYEYRLAVATYHTFLSKALRFSFVNPNKVIVKSPVDQEGTHYSGSATSAASYAKNPKTVTIYRRVASNAEAAAIAAAKIESYALVTEAGSVVVPMNCGQEIWDYVKLTDGREEDDFTGNVQRIVWDYKTPEGYENGVFSMAISFGRINTRSIGNYESLTGGEGLPEWLITFVNETNDVLIELLEAKIAISDYLKNAYHAITFVIDGGGSEITDGEKGHIYLPFSGTIIYAVLLADQSGSIVIDIWNDTLANFPPTNADSITASAPPTLSTDNAMIDATLTGWTKAFDGGDILALNVDSCTTITRVTLVLGVRKD